MRYWIHLYTFAYPEFLNEQSSFSKTQFFNFVPYLLHHGCFFQFWNLCTLYATNDFACTLHATNDFASTSIYNNIYHACTDK